MIYIEPWIKFKQENEGNYKFNSLIINSNRDL